MNTLDQELTRKMFDSAGTLAPSQFEFAWLKQPHSPSPEWGVGFHPFVGWTKGRSDSIIPGLERHFINRRSACRSRRDRAKSNQPQVKVNP